MEYQSYKDLDIYRIAHKLAIEIHRMTLTRLHSFEMYEEGRQIRRSSKSVVNNIVEGFGRRRYKNEFIQFVTYALGSCDETREHLDTLFESKSLKDKETYDYFAGNYEVLGKKVTKFTQAVEEGHLGPKTRI